MSKPNVFRAEATRLRNPEQEEQAGGQGRRALSTPSVCEKAGAGQGEAKRGAWSVGMGRGGGWGLPPVEFGAL